MKYHKSKGGRLFLNDNLFIVLDGDRSEIIPNVGGTDLDIYDECSKGEFLQAYSKVVKQLDKLAGI